MKRIDKSYIDINFFILVEYESLSIIAKVKKEPDSIVCFSYFWQFFVSLILAGAVDFHICIN